MLINNRNLTNENGFDIAGVASSILATPTILSLVSKGTGLCVVPRLWKLWVTEGNAAHSLQPFCGIRRAPLCFAFAIVDRSHHMSQRP